MKIITLKLILIMFINDIYCQNNYSNGFKEYEKNNFDNAILFFNKSILEKKELSKSYMFRGASNLSLNKVSEAKNDLDISFKLDSINENIYMQYGKYYILTKEFKKAIEFYNILISKKPKYAIAFDKRAVAKGLMGDFKGALQDVNIAIILEPKNDMFYSNRGFTKIKLNQHEEAIKDFDISLKSKPNQKDYANKGMAYLQLKMITPAIENFSKSLDFNPNDPETLYLRGYCYELLAIYDKACGDYSNSIKITNNQSSKEGIKRINCN